MASDKPYGAHSGISVGWQHPPVIPPVPADVPHPPTWKKHLESVASMVPPSGDAVQRPAHYSRFAIDPATYAILHNLPFAVGNVIKYVMRWDAKDGIQDLKKARRYLDMMIDMEERKLRHDGAADLAADVVRNPL